MNHTFDILHASNYGLQESILIANFEFWIQKNIGNKHHEHDGRTWTYNSVAAFEMVFPYLTYKQIRRALDSLIEQGVLVRGNYNSQPADRTSWFAFTDEFLESNPLPSRANGAAPQGRASALKGKSLIDPDITTDVNAYTLEFEQAWAAYPDRPGKSKADAAKAWNARLKAGCTTDEMTLGVVAYANYCRHAGTEPGYIKQPATFFGPGLHFRADWIIPIKPTHAGNLAAQRAAMLAGLTNTGEHDDHTDSNRFDFYNDPNTIDAETRRVD